MLILPAIPQIWGPAPSSRFKQELDQARLSQLIAHLPLLYGILGLNVIAIAFIFSRVAPPFLIFGAPSLLLVAGFLRAYRWQSRRGKPISPDQASAMLQSVQRFAIGFALAYMAWTLTLFFYGGAGLQGHLVYTVVLTDIICSFALAHLPRVALALSAISLPAFLLLLALSGGAEAKMIALNLAMVALFFGYMVTGSARDFEKLVEAQVRSVELADENRQLANTDSLTGLPNRREFFERLESAIDAEAAGGSLVVGVIDLDGFKPINDLYGHAIGDRVLKECAARLELFAGDGTTIARLGGDEFALFTRGRSSEQDIFKLGAQICAAIEARLELSEIHASLSASIGFARYPHDAVDAYRLYEQADYALYAAKQNRRGEAILFSPAHESKMLFNARIQQALRHADLEKEISVEFQPLLNAQSGRIIALEALARWANPDLGIVPPDQFIAVAECSENIHLVTRTVLRKALAAAQDWPDDIGLSFNLSARDLASPSAMIQLIALIERSALNPERLEIEVTETALIADFEHVAQAIDQLKALGASISLDDFGVGYSSLAHIHRLPVDRIKIDRSFVQEMHSSSAARDIVKSVIGLCGNLKLNCATEGVETPEQFDLLREYGCNVVQGFYFGVPVGEEAVAGLIAANRNGADGHALRA